MCACVYVEHPSSKLASWLATDPPAFLYLSIPPLSLPPSVYPFLRSFVQIGARLCSHALALTTRRGIGIANFPSFVRSFSSFLPPLSSLLTKVYVECRPLLLCEAAEFCVFRQSPMAFFSIAAVINAAQLNAKKCLESARGTQCARQC